MISISVKSNIDEVVRGLDDVARRQVRFAAAQALTFTARNAAADLKRELGSVFDRQFALALGAALRSAR